MKVRRGNISRNKSYPYYIELSDTYALLADLSANLSQTYKPISTDSQFRIRAAKRPHKKENDNISKYMYTNRNNDK